MNVGTNKIILYFPRLAFFKFIKVHLKNLNIKQNFKKPVHFWELSVMFLRLVFYILIFKQLKQY